LSAVRQRRGRLCIFITAARQRRGSFFSFTVAVRQRSVFNRDGHLCSNGSNEDILFQNLFEYRKFVEILPYYY
jgi:hypothetical protein